MHHLIGFVVFGAVLGGISATESKSKVRRVVRNLVKRGIVAKRKIDVYRSAAVSEAQKLVDEARAELDKPKTRSKAK
jgi:hypothetical protein